MEVQKYLNTIPKERRGETIIIDITDQVQGHLDLQEFPNLQKIKCINGNITSVDLTNNKKLKSIELQGNQIHQDLNIFSHLTQLEKLDLGQTERKGNDFFGSLKSLENCKDLSYLCIGYNEKITEGLEYLPSENLEWFGVHETVFKDMLKPFDYSVNL